MDRQKYRLNLSFPGLYREIELDGDARGAVIGTTRSCNIRLSRENFFCDFELSAAPDGAGQWELLCSETCCVSQNDVLKLQRIPLTHGDRFVVCYRDSGAELCRGEFLCDFESRGNAYCRYVVLPAAGNLRIGGSPGCQFYLRDPAVGAGYIELDIANGEVVLSDHGARYGASVNGNRAAARCRIFDYDFFSVAGHSFFLRRGRLYFCSDALMECRELPVYEHRDSVTQMEYPHLNRSTRIYRRPPQETISIQSPPARKDPPRQDLMMTILPAVVMLLITVLLRGAMGGGGAFVVLSACTMGMGIVTSVLNYRRQKRESTQGEALRVERYTAYIQEKEAAIVRLRQKEEEALEENTPCAGSTLQSVWRFDQRLYERTPADPDFLAVRLGAGPRESACPVRISVPEFRCADDPMADWPETIAERHRLLRTAPVLLEMRELDSVGLLGPAPELYEAVKLMAIDLCARHSHLDVQMCFFLREDDTDRWEWMRWLPHVNNPQTGLRNIACDFDSCKTLAESLYKELSEREARKADAAPLPHYVIFVIGFYDLMQHPLSRFFRCGPHGATFVFCRSAAELLPSCRKLVMLAGAQSRIVEADGGDMSEAFEPERVEDPDAARAALKLAGVRIDEVSLASRLTRSITLYRLLNIFSADDLDLDARWGEAEVYRSMAAPLGVNAKGDVVFLDLHEKAHGPHGLVAGTTGSGKSEILQSYILSMAALFHPYDVSFVIIDFKGGGMANQLRGLPHLLGSITDIDGREIQRSLLSIRAELNRRKALFAAAGVNHIDQYIRKFKEGALESPLPHLILIVDEFAELKAEQPDFMRELISAARVGRSLGVHLILATQKPSGVVDAQIWSNSRFRLCLKVAGPEDSREVLKTPLAAEIREPGRAYLQVGSNEVFELFQSAYSGASADSEISTGQRSYRIDRVDLPGVRHALYRTAPGARSRSDRTQLQAMTEMFRRHCEARGIARLPGICLPPLAAVIPCPDAADAPAGAAIQVPVGIYDDPARQAQTEYVVSPGAGHVLVVGASLSGKTCFLQQLVRGLSARYSPRDVNLYLVDFASRALGIFEGLNHVSGCVFSDQDDRVRTLMRLLLGEVRARKEAFSRAGVASFAGYREAGFEQRMPQIVVMMDNFTAFRELCPQYDDDLLFLLREGMSAGVCIVATVQQSGGMGLRYLNSFGTRVVMHCNDAGEYANVLDRCRMQPKNTPGRAVVCVDKECYEMQTYLAFAGSQERERAQSVLRYKEETARRFGEERAAVLPEIPEQMDAAWLRAHDAPGPERSPYTVTFGMYYDTVEFARLALDSMQLLSVSGPDGSGRANLLRLILDHLQRQVLSAPSECYILDGYDRKLAAYGRCGIVRRYTSDASEALDLLETVRDAARERQEMLRAGDAGFIAHEPLVVLMVRNPEFYGADKQADELFRDILRLGRGQKILCVLCNVENATVTFSSGGILKAVKENRPILFTDKLENLRICDLPPNVLRSNRHALRTGDAYWLSGDGAQRVRIAQADHHEGG